MAETFTAATSSPSATSPSAWITPARQAWSMSCSKAPATGLDTPWGTRARASTVPSSSAATAFTEVVPMSMPTVTSAAPRSVLSTGRQTTGMQALVFGTSPQPFTPPPGANRLVQNLASTPCALIDVPTPAAAPRLVRDPAAAHRHLRLGLEAGADGLRGRQRQRA